MACKPIVSETARNRRVRKGRGRACQCRINLVVTVRFLAGWRPPSVISPTYCNQASASASPEITLLKSSLTDFIASINQLLMHYNTELVTVT